MGIRHHLPVNVARVLADARDARMLGELDLVPRRGGGSRSGRRARPPPGADPAEARLIPKRSARPGAPEQRGMVPHGLEMLQGVLRLKFRQAEGVILQRCSL